MQYEPTRYPEDYDFRVRGAIGIMAREIEQQFMVNLASIIGPQHPASMPIIKAIFEHSGSPVKAEVLSALKALEEKAPDPAEEAARRAQLELPVAELEKVRAETLPVAELEKVRAETFKIVNEGGLKGAQTATEEAELEGIPQTQNIENLRALNDLQETSNQERQLDLLEDKNAIEREKIALQERNVKK
jgi:hypothetical protein